MKPLVTDALWERLEPLLPPAPQRRFHFPGRKPLGLPQDPHRHLSLSSRPASPGPDLPAELGCGCGKTCRGSISNAGTKRRLD